jgi:hypothetical protein
VGTADPTDANMLRTESFASSHRCLCFTNTIALIIGQAYIFFNIIIRKVM